MNDQPWMAAALCAQVDPEIWYAEGAGNDSPQAKRVCVQCPVRLECLWWAIDNQETHGIWGGLTYKQRLRFKRRAAA